MRVDTLETESRLAQQCA